MINDEELQDLVRHATKGDPSKLKELFTLGEKSLKDGNYIDAASFFRDSAIAYRIEAYRLRMKLGTKVSEVKYLTQHAEFLKECRKLKGMKELHESNSIPYTTKDLIKDFVLYRFNYKYSTIATEILCSAIEPFGGYSSPGSSFERYFIQRLIDLCINRQVIDYDASHPFSGDPFLTEAADTYVINSLQRYLKAINRLNKRTFLDEFVAEPIQMTKSTGDHYILYQTKDNIFKAPSKSTNPYQALSVKVNEICNYQNSIAKKYRYLLSAPKVDPYNNETEITFGKTNIPHLKSGEVEQKSPQWAAIWYAHFEEGHWLECSKISRRRLKK